MSAEEYAGALAQGGLPEQWASMYADFDKGIAQGTLENHSRELSTLIGRPTTPFKETVAQAVQR